MCRALGILILIALVLGTLIAFVIREALHARR